MAHIAEDAMEQQGRGNCIVVVEALRIGVNMPVPRLCNRNLQAIAASLFVAHKARKVEGELRLVAEILVDLDAGNVILGRNGVLLLPVEKHSSSSGLGKHGLDLQ